MVSHERDLLNNVVDYILHVERGGLTLYRGNYDSFARQRSERAAQTEAMRSKQEAQGQEAASLCRSLALQGAHRAPGAKPAQGARARCSRSPSPCRTRRVVFDFPSPKELKPPLVVLDGVAVGYVPGAPVLSHLNLRIDPDDRVALVGRNGNGKTTLARLLAGQLAPRPAASSLPASCGSAILPSNTWWWPVGGGLDSSYCSPSAMSGEGIGGCELRKGCDTRRWLNPSCDFPEVHPDLRSELTKRVQRLCARARQFPPDATGGSRL